MYHFVFAIRLSELQTYDVDFQLKDFLYTKLKKLILKNFWLSNSNLKMWFQWKIIQ